MMPDPRLDPPRKIRLSREGPDAPHGKRALGRVGNLARSEAQSSSREFVKFLR
jgi:hypothetical protein